MCTQGVLLGPNRYDAESNKGREGRGTGGGMNEYDEAPKGVIIGMIMKEGLTAVGFEPTQLALVELESTPLDHSGKLSCMFRPST